MIVAHLAGNQSIPAVNDAYGRLCSEISQWIYDNDEYDRLARDGQPGYYTVLFNDRLKEIIAERFFCIANFVWTDGKLSHGLDLLASTLSFETEEDMMHFIVGS